MVFFSIVRILEILISDRRVAEGEVERTGEEKRKSPHVRKESFKEKEECWHTGTRETNHNNSQRPLVLNDNLCNILNLLRKFTILLLCPMLVFIYILNII